MAYYGLSVNDSIATILSSTGNTPPFTGILFTAELHCCYFVPALKRSGWLPAVSVTKEQKAVLLSVSDLCASRLTRAIKCINKIRAVTDHRPSNTPLFPAHPVQNPFILKPYQTVTRFLLLRPIGTIKVTAAYPRIRPLNLKQWSMQCKVLTFGL